MTPTVPEIDCQEAAARLQEFIDAELSPETEAAVRQHLDDCAPCVGVYEFEVAFKQFVAAKGRGFTAPTALRDRIARELNRQDRPADA